MKSTRLFVGGLGDGVDKHMLTSKVSSYGSVSDIEVKEKTDAEGNVTFRFAYVNIEAAPEQIEQCVKALNGSSWQGSHLRVEVAKESFLDRLKRERAKTQEQQQQTTKSIQSGSPQKPERVFNGGIHDTKDHSSELEIKVRKKRKSIVLETSSPPAKLKTSEDQENDDVVQSVKVKHKSKKKNEEEEAMMASFKTFSSVWADSDDDDDSMVHKMSNKEKKKLDEIHSKVHKHFRDDEDEMTENIYADGNDYANMQEKRRAPSQIQDKRQNWGSPSKISKHNKKENDPPFKTMTRYDPTLEEHQQFRLLPSPSSKKVEEEVGSEKQESKQELKPVEGSVESSCFSLLSMFNQINQQEETAPEDDKKEAILEAPAQLPLRKSRSFFLGPNDKRIQDGIDWMMQNDQDKILPEFKAIENDLYEIIKTRSVRAKRDMNRKINEKGKGKSNDRLRSRKNAAIAVKEDQNYDHGWRLAEVIQNEKRRGTAHGRTRGGEGSHNQGRGGRGSHVSGQGEGDTQSWGQGEEGTRGRGRGGSHSRGRGEGDTHSWGQGEDTYGRGRGGSRGRGRGGSRSRGRGGSRSRGDSSGHDWGQGERDTHSWGRREGRGKSWGQGGDTRGRGRGGSLSRGRRGQDGYGWNQGEGSAHSWGQEEGGAHG